MLYFPYFLSQTQHECCLFVVSSSAFILCLCWESFLSQIHDERVVGTLEILCLLFNHYVEDLDIATPWEHGAVSMLTVVTQGIAKLEYACSQLLVVETQRFRC